jgi:hypothetical protein
VAVPPKENPPFEATPLLFIPPPPAPPCVTLIAFFANLCESLEPNEGLYKLPEFVFKPNVPLLKQLLNFQLLLYHHLQYLI